MATPNNSTDLALGKIHTFEHIAAEKSAFFIPRTFYFKQVVL